MTPARDWDLRAAASAIACAPTHVEMAFLFLLHPRAVRASGSHGVVNSYNPGYYPVPELWVLDSVQDLLFQVRVSSPASTVFSPYPPEAG